MRRNIPVVKYIGSIVILLLVLVSCNDEKQRGTAPRYTEHPSPAKVKVRFPKKSSLPALEFHIDNNNMRIFNKEYLPYQSKVDSAYLEMVVSTEATIRLLNETTNKTITYLPTDTGKVDLTGGRFKISIEVKDEPTLIYDMRLLSYGYDPTLFTWEREAVMLPEAAVESKVVEYNNEKYWICKMADGELALYSIGLSPISFLKVDNVDIPTVLMPSSILADKLGNYWALGTDGTLFVSENLKQWSEVTLGDVCLTMLLSDVSKEDVKCEITAVGYNKSDATKYFSYKINKEGVIKQEEKQLNETFPISDAYVYSYTIGGIQHSYILGGVMSDGRPAPTSFFTSDGVKWGKTPYSKDKQEVPCKGGLFLKFAPLDQSLYVVGGVYSDDKVSNLIKMSSDRGISWTELSKQQAPGENFAERSNASGFIFEGEGESAEFYIFGGIVSNAPTKEIWHGWLDRTGGIINNF